MVNSYVSRLFSFQFIEGYLTATSHKSALIMIIFMPELSSNLWKSALNSYTAHRHEKTLVQTAVPTLAAMAICRTPI